MAVSMTCCYALYGFIIIAMFLSILKEYLIQTLSDSGKTDIHLVNDNKVPSDEAIAEGMLWFSLGQNP
tara:strand:+ start:982 stop:1185 length:204 start_codon:yes stop_codon:yes gene_type:complete